MPDDDRTVEEWESHPTLLERADESLLAFAGLLVVGTITLVYGLLFVTAMCGAGVVLVGRQVLELAQDGDRYRAQAGRTNGTMVRGHVLDAGGGQVGILVDPTTETYPETGLPCRLYVDPVDTTT